MNAHAPKGLVAAIAVDAASCPAEAVGLQLAGVDRRMDELDRVGSSGGTEMRHLVDLREALDGQLEHVQAETVAGLLWQVAHLGVLFEVVSGELPGEPSDLASVRAFQRLHHQIIRGLEHVGGLDRQALGVGLKVCRGDAIRSALGTLD